MAVSMQVLCSSVLLMILWTSVLGKNITTRRVKKTFSDHHNTKVVKHSMVAQAESIQQIEARNPTTSMYVPFGLPERLLIDQQSYVTVFDEHRNIPFYSAYLILAAQAALITKWTRSEARTTWQEDQPSLNLANEVYEHNRNKDSENELQKGHMDPSFINSFDREYMSHTFVLSNAAPQYKTSNFGDWVKYEGWLAKYAQQVCAKQGGNMHIFTGTSNVYVDGKPDPEVPAHITKPTSYPKKPETAEQQLISFSTEPTVYPTITIPRSMWTAACCIKTNKQVIASMAVMTNNHWKEDQVQQTDMTVGQLQIKIKETAHNVVLFPAYPDCADENKNVMLSQMYAETK